MQPRCSSLYVSPSVSLSVAFWYVCVIVIHSLSQYNKTATLKSSYVSPCPTLRFLAKCALHSSSTILVCRRSPNTGIHVKHEQQTWGNQNISQGKALGIKLTRCPNIPSAFKSCVQPLSSSEIRDFGEGQGQGASAL